MQFSLSNNIKIVEHNHSKKVLKPLNLLLNIYVMLIELWSPLFGTGTSFLGCLLPFLETKASLATSLEPTTSELFLWSYLCYTIKYIYIYIYYIIWPPWCINLAAIIICILYKEWHVKNMCYYIEALKLFTTLILFKG